MNWLHYYILFEQRYLHDLLKHMIWWIWFRSFSDGLPDFAFVRNISIPWNISLGVHILRCSAKPEGSTFLFVGFNENVPLLKALALKRLGNVSFKERVKPSFFVAFYHKSHLFWKFHWNSSSRSETKEKFFANIISFHRFLSIFGIFWHFLVRKKQAYNT